jgi:hypothetical protein
MDFCSINNKEEEKGNQVLGLAHLLENVSGICGSGKERKLLK